MCSTLFFPLDFSETAYKVEREYIRDRNRRGRTRYAVLFFPFGFNEAAHKVARGYLRRNQEGIPFMDRTSDFTKEKYVNHKPNNKRRRERSTEHLWISINFGL